jgi:hypothetical protein
MINNTKYREIQKIKSQTYEKTNLPPLILLLISLGNRRLIETYNQTKLPETAPLSYILLPPLILGILLNILF